MISTGLIIALTLIAKSAPNWLPVINDILITPSRNAFIGKLVEHGFDVGIEKGRNFLHHDKKEQTHHLELALKNAGERAATAFTGFQQQLYSDVLTTLSQEGSHFETLRREAMHLFTLSDNPDLDKLNDLYNQVLGEHSQGQIVTIDARPYLSSFFSALLAELYIDPLYREQVSNILGARANVTIQRTLPEMVMTLRQVYSTLAPTYSIEQFEQDVRSYINYMEQTLHYLKLVGVVPKERINENRDPELQGIFVPLRVAPDNLGISTYTQQASELIVEALEREPCMMMLGGPGSGKSTASRYLAWSHAVVNQSTSPINISYLSRKPLPLRIELRRLVEDRRLHPDYDFLTYISEVLLGRAGLKVGSEMFKVLLERRAMLVLFDGLDEVATLDERRMLVEDIESFVRNYPGNYFLVTSRPVGYELAPLSKLLFCHTCIQSFDNEQIHLFLENWYAHVLRITPLTSEDERELEELFTAVKDNSRLRALAENPLLLTVITALHRYERLPDKRILVYDRCADLLLETWAKLRGTSPRWQNLLLSKDDQYACIAHLGIVLHSRAQEQQVTSKTKNTPTNNETDVDVPSRFIQHEIERYLEQQNLFPSKAEQHKQADRFLELVQEEAGLIVERGTDENGEPLYGFVHRTFQEYFAAADVYERYQQEEDPSIIRDFLVEHLHDPHWEEVILLLFGKLKRKPATAQLRQILEGRTESRRSHYSNILQQDLFFIATCLAEEIQVENELAEIVISRLGDLLVHTPFDVQRSEALNALKNLVQTQHHTSIAQKQLKTLIADNKIKDNIKISLEIASICLQCSDSTAQIWQAANELFASLIRRTDLPVSDLINAARTLLYESSSADAKTQQVANDLLLALIRRTDLPVSDRIDAASTLYGFIPAGMEAWQVAFEFLFSLAQDRDIDRERILQISLVIIEPYRVYLQESGNSLRQLNVNTQEDTNLFFENSEKLITAQISQQPEILAIPFFLYLFQNGKLPLKVRNDLYELLLKAVPRFEQLQKEN